MRLLKKLLCVLLPAAMLTALPAEPAAAVSLTEHRLCALRDEMTLEEKVAQLMLCCCETEAQALAASRGGAGGLCLFAAPFAGKSADAVRSMTASFQAAARCPVLVTVDEEGGKVNRVSLHASLRDKPFPGAGELYRSGGTEAVRADAADKAVFLRGLGIHVTLAPVCDVPLRTSDYIYPRCYSMDADEVSACVETAVTALHENDLGCTLKHFPGYGGSIDTHYNMSYDTRSLAVFEARDLLPFAAGIAAGADSVMVSHNIVQCMDAENPASLSAPVHAYLRDRMRFDGVVITDALEMSAITQFMGGKSPAVAAVLVGNDMLCTNAFSDAVRDVTAAVRAGTVSTAQIDASVLRILRWKASLGLLPDLTLPGDVDGTGSLSAADAVLLARMLAEDEPSVLYFPEAADLDGDGCLSTSDLCALLDGMPLPCTP